MATTVAYGVFNAFAFAGAGYLFKMFDHGGSLKEIKRHHLAIEKLAKAKEKWYEKQVANKNKILELQREQQQANVDMSSTNKALIKLYEITHMGRTFHREPVLSDYYKPSKEMKEFQHIATGVVGLIGGFVLYSVLL